MVEVGDRFRLPDEGIAGVVAEVFCGEDGTPVSAVIECDDGNWASVDLTLLERVEVH